MKKYLRRDQKVINSSLGHFSLFHQNYQKAKQGFLFNKVFYLKWSSNGTRIMRSLCWLKPYEKWYDIHLFEIYISTPGDSEKNEFSCHMSILPHYSFMTSTRLQMILWELLARRGHWDVLWTKEKTSEAECLEECRSAFFAGKLIAKRIFSEQ